MLKRLSQILFASWMFAAATFAISFLLLWLLICIISLSPTAPSPEGGLVVPFNNNGTMHYITTFELWSMRVIEVSVLASVSIMVVGSLSSKFARLRKRIREK
jgi:hypothetical protein